MKNHFLVALMMLLAVPFIWAQPTGKQQPTDKLENIANTTLNKNDTWNALDYYMQVYNRKPEDVKAIHDVAYSYYLLRDYKESASWYKKLLDADKAKQFPLTGWFYAYSLKLNGDYTNCIPQFEQFMNSYTGDNADKFKTLSQVEIEGAKYAQGLTASFEELKIDNAGKSVNSPSMENFAYPMGRSRVIFSSLRTDTIIFVEEADEDSKYAKIYSADAEGEGTWKKAELFNPSALNRKEFHSVHPTFSPKMDKMYFVRARLTGNMLNNSKIYVCSYDNGTLGDAMVLDFNSNDYSCKNPIVASIDGKEYLFFSSDMPGGKGGFDIWYAEINADGTTRQPLNLGEPINTVGDEITPFFDSRDNYMYFSSTGHPGLGGIDIFKSLRNAKTGNWDKPVNMGQGFNTSVDDFGFIINREGNDDCYGYLVSNRKGTMTIRGETCTDDIFSVLMPERCDVVLTFFVQDNDKKTPVNGSTVRLMEKGTANVVQEQTNSEGNKFVFMLQQGKEYDVVATKEGWETGGPVYVDARRTALEKRFGSINKPMAWDETGYIKEAGLMVETFNKKTNEAMKGVTVLVYDAATGQEVKQQTVADGNRFVFMVPRTKNYRIQARMQGFVGESKEITAAEMKNLQKLFLTPPPIFVNIYFDFDKSDIRPGAADTLQQIFAILNDHPDMVVEVRGHTDAMGPDTYNDALSNRRSNAAIEWLSAKGIEKSRLISKGFGEKEPAAPNTTQEGQDDPLGRQLNRRVEFKVIKGEGAVGEVAPSNTETKVAVSDKKKN